MDISLLVEDAIDADLGVAETPWRYIYIWDGERCGEEIGPIEIVDKDKGIY